MCGACVKEERGKQGPDSSGQKVVPAEHEICIDEVGVLLPSPEAQAYASEYEKIVDPHPGPLRSVQRLSGLFQKFLTTARGLLVISRSFCKDGLRQTELSTPRLPVSVASVMSNLCSRNDHLQIRQFVV